VPTVPITPTRPVRVARTADTTAGSMTPTIGTGKAAVTSTSASAAVAVLQAATTNFTSWARSHPTISSTKPRTSSRSRGP